MPCTYILLAKVKSAVEDIERSDHCPPNKVSVRSHNVHLTVTTEMSFTESSVRLE